MLPKSLRSLFPIVSSFFLLSVSHAKADVAQAIPEIGDLERWAAFSLGAGNNFSRALGDALIDGDLGLAGNGKFLMANRAIVDGDVYYRSNGAVLTLNHALITGSTFNNQDAILDNEVNEALAASDHAASLIPNRSN